MNRSVDDVQIFKSSRLNARLPAPPSMNEPTQLASNSVRSAIRNGIFSRSLRNMTAASVLMGALPPKADAVVLLEPDATLMDTRYLGLPNLVPQSQANLWMIGQRVSNGEQFVGNAVRLNSEWAISMDPVTHSDSGPITILQAGTGQDSSNPTSSGNVQQLIRSTLIDASAFRLDTPIVGPTLTRAAGPPSHRELLYVFAFGTVGLPGQALQVNPFQRGFQIYAYGSSLSDLDPANYGSALFVPGDEATLDVAEAATL